MYRSAWSTAVVAFADAVRDLLRELRARIAGGVDAGMLVCMN